MDIAAVAESVPSWAALPRIATTGFVSSLLIYFGYWLRGDAVKQLQSERDYLRSKLDQSR